MKDQSITTLLGLLDVQGNPSSDEAAENLNVIMAELDGFERLTGDPWLSMGVTAFIPRGWTVQQFIKAGEPAVYASSLPNYTKSLDAISRAETRAGLRDHSNGSMRRVWVSCLESIVEQREGIPATCSQTALATAAQRTISLIMLKRCLPVHEPA